MRVGVLTQAAQSACLVRLQLLARPVISQVKLPHLRYQAQYDLNIHGVLPSSNSFLRCLPHRKLGKPARKPACSITFTRRLGSVNAGSYSIYAISVAGLT